MRVPQNQGSLEPGSQTPNVCRRKIQRKRSENIPEKSNFLWCVVFSYHDFLRDLLVSTYWCQHQWDMQQCCADNYSRVVQDCSVIVLVICYCHCFVSQSVNWECFDVMWYYCTICFRIKSNLFCYQNNLTFCLLNINSWKWWYGNDELFWLIKIKGRQWLCRNIHNIFYKIKFAIF